MHYSSREGKQHPGGSLLDEFGWNLRSLKWCRSSSFHPVRYENDCNMTCQTVIIIIIIMKSSRSLPALPFARFASAMRDRGDGEASDFLMQSQDSKIKISKFVPYPVPLIRQLNLDMMQWHGRGELGRVGHAKWGMSLGNQFLVKWHACDCELNIFHWQESMSLALKQAWKNCRLTGLWIFSRACDTDSSQLWKNQCKTQDCETAEFATPVKSMGFQRPNERQSWGSVESNVEWKTVNHFQCQPFCGLWLRDQVVPRGANHHLLKVEDHHPTFLPRTN